MMVKFRAWASATNVDRPEMYKMYPVYRLGFSGWEQRDGKAPLQLGTISVFYEDAGYWCEVFVGFYTLMQYTGLKDVNDKDICEGDLLKVKSYSFHHLEKYTYEVYYNDQSMRFKLRNNIPYPHNIDDDSTGLHSFEIIGNIYQNPEMIKN